MQSEEGFSQKRGMAGNIIGLSGFFAVMQMDQLFFRLNPGRQYCFHYLTADVGREKYRPIPI